MGLDEDTLLIGSDPELFLITSKAGELARFYNAYNSLGKEIKGTKHRPEPTDYGAIQVDGMAVEINTHPTNDVDIFQKLVAQGLTDVRRRFPERRIAQSCTWSFSPFELEEQPPLSLEMGCDPDMNAWMGGHNFAPDPATLTRACGGHIHLGWRKDGPIDDAHIEECTKIVKQLDYFVGMWSCKKDKHFSQRRVIYGSAGSFRPKPYGLEYRVPSNFWLFDADKTREIFLRTRAAYLSYREGNILEDKHAFLAPDYIDGVGEYNPIGFEQMITYTKGVTEEYAAA
jgi:hypothetical protein